MAKKLYVGNLSYGMTDQDLVTLFEPHGAVRSAQVIMDRDTGRSKGFGFVEMEQDQQAQAAIAAVNGKEINGRTLTVNEARPARSGAAAGAARGASAAVATNQPSTPSSPGGEDGVSSMIQERGRTPFVRSALRAMPAKDV